MLPDKPTLDEDDDELPLELPETGGAGEDEAAWEPDDDSDLGVNIEDENVGLDADTGTAEDAIENEGLGEDDDEAGTWLDDGRGVHDDGEDDDGDEAEEEYGLIEGSEPAVDPARDDWDSEDLESDEAETTGDAGEEGFGDDLLAGEIDPEGLPPLDDGGGLDEAESDPEAEAFAAELDAAEAGGLAALALGELVADGLRCTRFASDRVIVEILMRGGRPLSQLLAAGDAGVGWDGTLLVADAVAARAERRFAAAEAALALAAADTLGGPAIALATPSGLLCSSDGGRTFAAARALGLPAQSTPLSGLALLPLPGNRGLRLWAAAPHGALYVSDDFGASFREPRLPFAMHVLRVSASAAASVLLFGRGQDGRACALRSNDYGERFERVELPEHEVERVQDVAIAGELTLCTRRAPLPQLVIRRSGGDFAELAPQAAAPALLLVERDGPSAYFCVRASDGRSLVMRRAFDASGSLPSLVCELESGAGTPLQLAGAHGSGITTLQLGTERAWYRIALRLDGGVRD